MGNVVKNNDKPITVSVNVTCDNPLDPEVMSYMVLGANSFFGKGHQAKLSSPTRSPMLEAWIIVPKLPCRGNAEANQD